MKRWLPIALAVGPFGAISIMSAVWSDFSPGSFTSGFLAALALVLGAIIGFTIWLDEGA